MKLKVLWIPLVALLLAEAALGNPVYVDVQGQLLRALDRARAGTVTEPDTLLEILGDGKALEYYPAAFEVIDQDFPVFAPYLVRSQLPPHKLDYQLQDWYLERANEVERGYMLGALRDRIAVPLQFAGGDTTTLWQEHKELAGRVDAAERLVDLGDESAEPLISSLIDSLERRAGGVGGMSNVVIEMWWYLRCARLRLASESGGVLIVQRDESRLDFAADLNTVTVTRYVPFFVGSHPEMPVANELGAKAMRLVQGASVVRRCRERRRAPCAKTNDGMMIQLADGRELTLSYNEGVLLCSDNTRYFRWAYVLKQNELKELLLELKGAFQAELPRFPPYDSRRGTGMPN